MENLHHFKCKSKGHAYFDGEYLGNSDSQKHITIESNRSIFYVHDLEVFGINNAYIKQDF